MMVPILLNTAFTVELSDGMAATAATATSPAAKAYSTRSCPSVSFQNCCQNFFIVALQIHVIANCSCCIFSVHLRWVRKGTAPILLCHRRGASAMAHGGW